MDTRDQPENIEDAPRYQILLEQEMLDRQRINSKFSAGAMARHLRLSPSFFSQLLSGKRSLSDETAEQIARQFNWTSTKRKAFVLLAQIARTKSPQLKEALTREYSDLCVPVQDRKGFRRLKLDSFNLISDWYHFALVELADLKQFKRDIPWMARSLKISTARARDAVDRLIRVGLLSSDLKRLEPNYRIGDVPSRAIQRFHRQILKLAERALSTQSQSERDFSGCTFAIDPDRIPQARELIRNFQKELLELMKDGEKTAVYQLSVQFFRLNWPDNEEK